MKRTHREVKDTIAALGLVARRTECAEWRINFRDGSEETAYYTDDDEDAIETARALAALRAPAEDEPVCERCGKPERAMTSVAFAPFCSSACQWAADLGIIRDALKS